MTSSISEPSATAPDTDAELKLAWGVFGRPDGYEAPTEQETRDLGDARNRARGMKAQRKRLKRNRQQLERERSVELGIDSSTSDCPALPHYLLDRTRYITRCDVPSYLFVQQSQPDSDDGSSGEEERLWERAAGGLAERPLHPR